MLPLHEPDGPQRQHRMAGHPAHAEQRRYIPLHQADRGLPGHPLGNPERAGAGAAQGVRPAGCRLAEQRPGDARQRPERGGDAPAQPPHL